MSIATPLARAEDWIIGEAQAAPDPQPNDIRQVAFAIPQGPLQSALEIFSVQSGTQTLYQASITVGRTSHAVKGSFDATSALRMLLQGTGLTAVEVFKGGFTLIPIDQAGTVAASTSQMLPMPANAPILSLKMLHVQAPSEEERRLYAKTVQFAIMNALSHDHTLRRIPYSADIFVWVSPAGMVQNASLFTSTGNASIDGAIARMLRTVEVGRPPPLNLPQPVHVRILTETAAR